jgi:hypothetical protein
MTLIFKTIKSMRWFFVSVVLIFFIGIILSHIASNSMSQNILYNSIEKHNYFWSFVRLSIVMGFVIVWPYLVRHWSKKYQWKEEDAKGVIHRRWRYAIWLIIVNFIFQLLL